VIWASLPDASSSATGWVSTGIVAALVLSVAQFALFPGSTATSDNSDLSNAGAWTAFHGAGYFDTGTTFSEHKPWPANPNRPYKGTFYVIK